MRWRASAKAKVKSKKAKETSDQRIGGSMSQSPKDIKERAFEFALRIVTLCQHLDKQPGVPRTLAPQLLKAGTSVGANIQEAQAGQSRADFIRKNSIALKEARECHYWLRLLIAAEVMPKNLLAELRDEAEELKLILGSIVIRTKRRTV
jgi:four helix bundle protein